MALPGWRRTSDRGWQLEHYSEDVYDEMEADLVADGELLLHLTIKSDVIETDRTLLSCWGAAEIFGTRCRR